jgi:F-type H+-transporting ATPase subunit delta
MDTLEDPAMTRTKQARREAKQVFRLCLVNGSLDQGRVRAAVRRVAESKNRNRLTFLSHFRRLLELDHARHTATVENATPLSADMQARIQAGLSHTYGPGLNTTFTHNPDLIGGMRIKVGSDVYDSSIKARLAAIQARF